jgi:UDP-N-acetylglucosamine 2-epimerase
MKLASIVGARPQFIKVPPILRAIQTYNDRSSNAMEHVLIHTGQHYDYDMSQAFFVDLDLPEPNYNLGVGSGSHGRQTGEMLKQIEKVLLEEQPDLVLIYGDTNSTLAAAIAAIKLRIRIAHVEAGLREYDKRIPEEVNRRLTDHVSSLLFCPSRVAIENLRREGFENIAFDGELAPLDSLEDLSPFDIDHPLVINTGDVMYDSVLYNVRLAEKRSDIFQRLHLGPKEPNKLNEPYELNKPVPYALATVHRAENTDDPVRLAAIFEALDQLATQNLRVIMPLHPRTMKALAHMSAIENLIRNLEIIDPVPYKDMLMLEKNAQVILTDSGGMQKEAYWLSVPCITLRDVTGWIETVRLGWNTLVGCDPTPIVQAALGARSGLEAVHPYGDGRAAERIVEVLVGEPGN